MPMIRNSIAASDAKGRFNSILVLCIITTLLLTSATAQGTQMPLQATMAAPPLGNGATTGVSPDPSAFIYGNHLYDARNWYIPSTGQNFTLDFPPNWNVTRLGLNFYNGTLLSAKYVNTTTVSTSVVQLVASQFEGFYQGLISNLKVPKNSTIYQAMFSINGMLKGDNNFYVIPNGGSNSSYPVIDGNLGLAQRFFLSTYTENLSVQVNLFRFDGTVGNLTAEVRRSTYSNEAGEFVKSVSLPSTFVSLGANWIPISIPHVNLTAGYYYLVLHTTEWVSSGGGYAAGTTLQQTAD